MSNSLVEWRGTFSGREVGALYAAAFERPMRRVHPGWRAQPHRLGWVTATVDGDLVGFASVAADGSPHAQLGLIMVAPHHQRSGIGSTMVRCAADRARVAGCEWLHADFDDDVVEFFERRCGFNVTVNGVLDLRQHRHLRIVA